ncbi:MAG: hypothetical protein JNL40_10470 [Cyclobacteriaceae bacterium]|nr:hypothetical protein [Cyclobacteriaceae bacterium]
MHLCSYNASKKMLRKALTLLLLLLFSAEMIALASTLHEEHEQPIAHHQQLVAHEFSTSFSLLAEETEERDQRDSILLPLERELLHPHVFPLIDFGKGSLLVCSDERPVVKPLYTLHRTLLI